MLKRLSSLSEYKADQLHYQLKMLEFNNIKTLQAAKHGIYAARYAIKERLNTSTLNNKQKAEMLLVAEIEVYKMINVLINRAN